MDSTLVDDIDARLRSAGVPQRAVHERALALLVPLRRGAGLFGSNGPGNPDRRPL